MRTTTGQFLPGKSGNPSGRPAIVTELQLLARAHTSEALNTLVAIMTTASAPAAARVAAATALLDRGYGRPSTAIVVESAGALEGSPERDVLLASLADALNPSADPA